MKFSLPFLTKSGKTGSGAAKLNTKPGRTAGDGGSVRHASLGKAKYQLLIAGVLLLGMLALFV